MSDHIHTGVTDSHTDEILAMTPTIALVNPDGNEATKVSPQVEVLPNGILAQFGDKTIYFSLISAIYFGQALEELSINAMMDNGLAEEVTDEDE